MRTVDSILDLIGGTPLLRLGELEPEGGAEIWAKLEAYNPGFSVKDRVGLALVAAAERDGRLQPGGTIVEATAGNTGLALALVGRRKGYRVVLVVPETFSIEKQLLMKALGGEVETTPTADGMLGAKQRAKAIADDTTGAVYVDQFSNPANPEAHATTTGPEIWQQMAGQIDGFVAGCGSGGTFSGAARYLKVKNPKLYAVAVEPQGSVLAGGEPGPHEVEGIGMDTVYATMDLELADEVATVHDPDAFRWVRRLATDCGVLGGSSAGAAVHAAVATSLRLGPGKRVAVVIPDSSERYLSKDIYEKFTESQS